MLGAQAQTLSRWGVMAINGTNVAEMIIVAMTSVDLLIFDFLFRRTK